MRKIPWQEHVLMIPGPTPVSPQALAAAGQPMMNHRGAEFKQMIEEVEKGLREVFQTQSSVAVLTSSGTGAMEAAIVNVLSPGDKVLACPTGVFGERFAKIARAYGAAVEVLETPLGEGVNPEAVKGRLKQDARGEIKAILLTHNETSTAVENDLQAISEARGNHPALILVDSVSALGASELRMDAWRLDVVASASQKALMAPPGLSFVALGPRAWEANREARMPRFYFDLSMARDFQAKGQTPFTPALSVLYAQQVSLRMLLEEGLENSYSRHKRMARGVRAALEAMGLKLFAHPKHRSNTVTAIENPSGVDIKKIREDLRVRHGLVLAGGQGPLSEKIFRMGHMGTIGEKEILYALSALGKALREERFPARTEEALRSFTEALSPSAASSH